MLDIRRAGIGDIPFIMATERRDGYDRHVGRWSEARHLAALDDPGHVYFVARLDDRPVGFVIVRDWNSPERATLVKRIAVTDPGRGIGRKMLTRVVDTIFAETEAHRVWLGVFTENARARRAYAAIGFREEGVARGSAYFDGMHRDEMMMAVLRPEWAEHAR